MRFVPGRATIGQQAGWRAAFLALSGIGLAAMVAIAAWLPAGAPGRGHAARGTAPDARRYLTLMAMTVLAATGTFAAYTYITPFLTSAFTPLAGRRSWRSSCSRCRGCRSVP